MNIPSSTPPAPGYSSSGGGTNQMALVSLIAGGVTWFIGWLGGPQHYIERFGHPRLRARHLPFKIGLAERDQWVACMDQAMGETGVPDALRARLRESFMGTADWMRNKGV